jgi:hypothetical protein
MSTANVPEPVSGKRVVIDAPWLWGGGLATAVVAALVALVGDRCRLRRSNARIGRKFDLVIRIRSAQFRGD